MIVECAKLMAIIFNVVTISRQTILRQGWEEPEKEPLERHEQRESILPLVKCAWFLFPVLMVG